MPVLWHGGSGNSKWEALLLHQRRPIFTFHYYVETGALSALPKLPMAHPSPSLPAATPAFQLEGIEGYTRMDLRWANASASPHAGAASTEASDGGIEVSVGVLAGDPPDLGAGGALEVGAAHPTASPASVASPKVSEAVGEAALKSSS